MYIYIHIYSKAELQHRQAQIQTLRDVRSATSLLTATFEGLRVGTLVTSGSFRKLGVPSLGVLIIRILLFRVLY